MPNGMLLRTVARTAVISGTATHVSNNVSRRQSERWAAQQQQGPYEAAPAAAPAESNIAQLKELGELRAKGVLTEAEFEAEKAKLL